MIVNTLLPPLITVSGWLVQGIGELIKVISRWFRIQKGQELGQQLSDLGKSVGDLGAKLGKDKIFSDEDIKNITGAMFGAADKLANIQLTRKVEEETGEVTGKIVNVGAGGNYTVESAGTKVNYAKATADGIITMNGKLDSIEKNTSSTKDSTGTSVIIQQEEAKQRDFYKNIPEAWRSIINKGIGNYINTYATEQPTSGGAY